MALYKRQYTDKTLTFRKSIYNVRGSGASELRKFSHLHILKLLFLSIFCWYFKDFVGTNIMLASLHVPTNFQMQFPFYILLMTWHYKRLRNYRQNIHIEIIYVCERGNFFAFLHSKPSISFIIFVGFSDILSV